jgi:hypothetical protein
VITRRVYEIVSDDDNSFWMLLEDGCGIARSKSRNALRRIRDALVAVEGGGLVGLVVEEDIDPRPRGVVQAISGNDLIVRLPDDKLDSWNVRDCRLVEPERPTTPTPWNDPAIGIYPAVDLLKRVVALANMEDHAELALAVVDVAEDAEKFLEARKAAQPT